MSEFKTGDKVHVNHEDFFLGTGIIVALANRPNARMATVQTFDGMVYSVPVDGLTQIKE